MSRPHEGARRYRASDGPAILAQGFRPFFLAAGLWAPIALGLFLHAYLGVLELPSRFDPVAWHGHELLFGYVAASIGGFLLTAIPNWTGRLPLHGPRLLALVLLWLVGRLAMLFSAYASAAAVAAADLAFLVMLCFVTGREIAAGRNWRNLPVVGVVAVLTACNGWFHAEQAGLVATDGMAMRFAIAVVIVLISLIGGRVVPSFTRNWLARQDTDRLPAPFGHVDRATLAATAIAMAALAVAPDSGATAVLAALGAVLNAVRLARWRGGASGPEPLLWVLHLGYAWIPVGLALVALSHWWPALPPSGALHAFTAGAMGTMTLAVMSRATLGHTGRALRAGAGLTAAYVLVSVGALARILASLTDEAYLPLLIVAAAAWILAFLAYVAVCGPMLVTRREG